MQTNSPIPANPCNTLNPPASFTHTEIKAALHSWFIHERKRNPSFAPKDEHTGTICDTPDLYSDLIFRNLEGLIRQNNLKQLKEHTNEQ